MREKSYVLPVRVQSASVPTLSGTSNAYFFLSKPIKITKVGKFSNTYISIKYPVGTYFSSFTYEALIYVNSFASNNTIMGTEGVMIFRIGDAPGVPKDVLEAAGTQNYHTTGSVEDRPLVSCSFDLRSTFREKRLFMSMVRNGLDQIGAFLVSIRIRMSVSISVGFRNSHGENVR